MWRDKEKEEKETKDETHEALRGATGSGNVTVGQSATGTTTVGSLVTNISTTGAATVNIGNTGTSVTAGSIVNIGTGATGITIGNTGTIINLGKVRMINSPMIAYCFESGAVQSIPTGQSTAIVFPTALANNGTGTGITYNSGTGLFTNSNSYSVTAIVCASVGFAFNGTGARVAYIQHNNTGNSRLATGDVGANSTDYTYLSLSGSVVLASGDTLQVYAYQTSGGALNVGDSLTAKSSRISILVM